MGTNDPQRWIDWRRVYEASDLPNPANDARTKDCPTAWAMICREPILQCFLSVTLHGTEDGVEQHHAQHDKEWHEFSTHVAVKSNPRSATAKGGAGHAERWWGRRWREHGL
jgi:hypothetical protein